MLLWSIVRDWLVLAVKVRKRGLIGRDVCHRTPSPAKYYCVFKILRNGFPSHSVNTTPSTKINVWPVRFIKKYLKSFQNVPSWNVAPGRVAKHSSSSLWLSICLNLGFISLWNIIPLGILIIFNKICGNIILLWLTKLRMRNECL